MHAARRLVSNLPAGHVVVKLDFSNAFNCVRQDLILDSIATNIPEIYRLVYSAFSFEPVLTFGSHEILSSEGAHQGDPLGSLEFCESIHPLLLKLHSSIKIGFMDDLTLSGDLHTVERYHNDHGVILRDRPSTSTWTNVKSSQTISQKSAHLPCSMILSVSTRRTCLSWGLLSSKATHRTRPFRTR